MNRKWLTGRIILRVICTATNMDPSTSMIGDPMLKNLQTACHRAALTLN